MPNTIVEWEEIAENYFHLWNFPNCIGAMDGRHILFNASRKNGSLYYNYKGTISIILLALVDAHYRFIYINVGANGRVSDGGVFNGTDLANLLTDSGNPRHLPPDRPLPRMNELVPYVILADAAFPLQKHIMKPYPSRNLSHEDRIFNYRLSRGRRIVENAFGILANRFRILLSAIYLSADKVQNITLACCVLHNFLCNKNSAYLRGVTDTENLESQTVTPGSWRNNNVQMHGLQITNIRPNRNAIEIRNIFRRYWQDRMIE